VHQDFIGGVPRRPEDRHSECPARRRGAYLEPHRRRHWNPADRLAEVRNQKTPRDRFREQMGGALASPDPGFLSGFLSALIMDSYAAFVSGIGDTEGGLWPSGVSPRCFSREGKRCTCITSNLLIRVIYKFYSYALLCIHEYNIMGLE